MRVVIQRVKKASVVIERKAFENSISTGLLLFVGIEEADDESDVNWLAHKIINMRIFADTEGKMNQSILDVAGELLLISQFTLHASTKKGNRPSFIKAAKPEKAIPLYKHFIAVLEKSELLVKTGVFGGDMQVSLVNDGPVTIIMDSKNRG